jgi:outer membrane cobalamin receptor
LYGSNAYLGVINIILRKNADGDVNVRIGSGTRRMGTAGANVSLSKNDFSLFISGNSSYDIQKPYELTGKRQDLYKGDSVFMFQREVKSSNFNVLSGYKSFRFIMNRYEYQHAFLGINPSFISGGNKPMTDRGTLLAVKYQNQSAKKVNLLADLAYDYFKRDYASNQDGSTALMLSGERLVATLKLNYTISTALDVEAGVDAEKRMNGKHVSLDVLKDTVLRHNLKNARNINEVSAFTQLHYKTGIANILGGLRYTNNSFSGNNLSGRVSLVSDFSDTNSIKLIYGQSYRAPTMLELFFDHPTVVGNINLKPEKAHSVELAFVHGHGNLFFQMLGYYHKLHDLIQRYTPPTGPPSMYQNISSIEGCGFELEAKYQKPGFLNAFFNYNFMSGLGQNAALNYRLVPNHTVKAGANKSFGNFFVSVNGYAVSSVMGNPKLNQPLAAQLMLDGHVGYKHILGAKKMAITHMLSAKNLTSSQMLIPEYIRQTDNINSMATTGTGIRLMYTLTLAL